MCCASEKDFVVKMQINNNLTAMASAHDVNVVLYPYAASLYAELHRNGIIERMKEINQLGAIRVKKKYIKTRYNYTMLQLYYHQLVYKGGLNDELQFSYGNALKANDFSNDIDLNGLKAPSIYDAVQLFTIIYNAGHFYPTFVASRAAIEVALEDELFRKMLQSASSDPRFSSVVSQIIENRDYHKFHLVNSLLILDDCDQTIDAVRICRELVYAFFNNNKTKKEAYVFDLIKIIRNLSYISYDLQIAHTALRVDLNNDKAIIELLRERIIEYNDNVPAHNLIASIQKILDDTIYNEKSNALILYGVTRKIVKEMIEQNWGVGCSYYKDLFLNKNSSLNCKRSQSKNFDDSNILKLTFSSDERHSANQMIDLLGHTRFVQVAFYNRNNGYRTVLVALAKNCKKKAEVSFTVLRKTISVLRNMPTVKPSDDRYLLVAKFFLFYLFAMNRIKLKATISEKCVICNRGYKQRTNTLSKWITDTKASPDTVYETRVMLSVLEQDKKNDTALALPCSILVMNGKSSGKALVECDGLVIFPTRKKDQIIIFEAKNRKAKPQRGRKELQSKISKLGITSVTIEPLGYDAKALITI